jgi:hypothetical protein
MQLRTIAFASFVTLLAACGSDAGPCTSSCGTSGPMKASINGTDWVATTGAAVGIGSGGITLSGIRVGEPAYTLSFQLYNILGTGIYEIGSSPNMNGGSAVVSRVPSGGWSTPLNGESGEINITTLTSARIAGTFSFIAQPLAGTTGTMNVTSGSFDLPITGTVGSVPSNGGNSLSATISSTAFNAGDASLIYTSGASPTLTISATNVTRNIGISLANVTGPGTFTLSASPLRTIQVTGAINTPGATWGSQVNGGSGSVNVTALSADRIVGTFTATLAPVGGGATGNLTLTGSFDMGRRN